METLKKAFRWCKRYISLLFIGIVALFVYVLFFNDNSYSNLSELNTRIGELKEEIQENRDTMLYYQHLNRLLESSPAEMERIARERYFMQGRNEDVYIIVNK